MRIGIDIDDTTVKTVDSMIKYADLFDKQLGGNGINGNMGLINNRYYLKALYGWNDEEKNKFFNIYYKKILEECICIPNSAEIIQKLKNEGHEIFFITARLINIENCDTEKITLKTLNENKIPYDKVIINASDKLRVCQECGIELFIEDSFETCKELEENGIKTYLMTTPMNRNIDVGNVERISDWLDLDKKIHNYLDK